MSEQEHYYRFIGEATRRIHSGMLAWISRHLEMAGLRDIVVSGLFPAEDDAAPRLVTFPYQVGPDVKLREVAQRYNLLQLVNPNVTTRVTDVTGRNIAPAWNSVGLAIKDALLELQQRETSRWPEPPGAGARPLQAHAFRAESLPTPLRRWYEGMTGGHRQSWHEELRTKKENGSAYLIPYLGWQLGFSLSINYLVMIGRQLPPGQPAMPPDAVALSALAVLTGAIIRERTLRIAQPPRQVQPELLSFLEAVLGSLRVGSPAHAALDRALKAIAEEEQIDITVEPIQDLDDKTVSMVMLAVGRPLQPYINMRLRFRLGDGPEMAATAITDFPRDSGTMLESEVVRTATASEAIARPLGFASESGPVQRPRRTESYAHFVERARDEEERQLEELRNHPLYADMPAPGRSGNGPTSGGTGGAGSPPPPPAPPPAPTPAPAPAPAPAPRAPSVTRISSGSSPSPVSASPPGSPSAPVSSSPAGAPRPSMPSFGMRASGPPPLPVSSSPGGSPPLPVSSSPGGAPPPPMPSLGLRASGPPPLPVSSSPGGPPPLPVSSSPGGPPPPSMPSLGLRASGPPPLPVSSSPGGPPPLPVSSSPGSAPPPSMPSLGLRASGPPPLPVSSSPGGLPPLPVSGGGMGPGPLPVSGGGMGPGPLPVSIGGVGKPAEGAAIPGPMPPPGPKPATTVRLSGKPAPLPISAGPPGQRPEPPPFISPPPAERPASSGTPGGADPGIRIDKSPSGPKRGGG